LVILAFILLALGHANFECQHTPKHTRMFGL